MHEISINLINCHLTSSNFGYNQEFLTYTNSASLIKLSWYLIVTQISLNEVHNSQLSERIYAVGSSVVSYEICMVFCLNWKVDDQLSKSSTYIRCISILSLSLKLCSFDRFASFPYSFVQLGRALSKQRRCLWKTHDSSWTHSTGKGIKQTCMSYCGTSVIECSVFPLLIPGLQDWISYMTIFLFSCWNQNLVLRPTLSFSHKMKDKSPLYITVSLCYCCYKVATNI